MAESTAENESFDFKPTYLIACNVLGIFISYSITIILARNLTHASFEQYIGTVATLGMMASLGEAGFGKYALKIVPLYLANQSIRLLTGYLRFACIGCVLLSVLLGVIAIAIESPLRSGGEQRIIFIAFIFLPVVSASGVAIDILLAFGISTFATTIARIAVPLTTLSLILGLLWITEITSFLAIVCFSAGSLIGLVSAIAAGLRKIGPIVKNSKAENSFSEWTWHGLSYLVFATLITWVFKAPLILLHHLPHQANELAMFAPAFETGCLVLLLAKSTDKYFQPTMSIIIASGDWEYGRKVRRQRYWVVGSGVVAFLMIVFWLGRSILSLYGDDFPAAFPALCVIAIGSSCWTLFSLAPGFLQFAGEYKFLLRNLLVHGLLLAILTMTLFNYYGVNGAACAFAITICLLSLTNLAQVAEYVAR